MNQRLRNSSLLCVHTLQAATQFKNSLMKLMEILMSKEPSYVRCIKPNDGKQAGTDCLLKHLSLKSVLWFLVRAVTWYMSG